MHTRGARTRLKLIHSGKADFGIVSRFSFDNNFYPDLEILHNYGVNSYLDKHVIVTRVGETIPFNAKIGIDENSYDQDFLSKKYFCSKDQQFINVNYHSLIVNLMNKTIDATILNIDEDRVKALQITDISDNKYPSELTEAVLVIHKDNYRMKSLKKILKGEE